MKTITKSDKLILMNLRWHICLLLVAAVFTSCSSANSESLSKSASKEHEKIIKENEILWDDCLSQKESDYLVFVYSETCSHCHEIMGDVTSFAQSNILKTYFVNKSNSSNIIPICAIDEVMVNVDQITDLAIAGTPTMFEVEEGQMTSNIFGADSCLTFLNELRLKKKN